MIADLVWTRSWGMHYVIRQFTRSHPTGFCGAGAVLATKLKAILSDIGARRQTSADPNC